MAGSSFTFRCFECNQLLKVAQSRVGSTVACPRCGIDLIIPEPPASPPTPSGSELAPPRASNPVPIPDPSPVLPIPAEPAPATSEAPGFFPPIALGDDPLSLRPASAPRPTRPPDRPREKEAPASNTAPAAGSGFPTLRDEPAPVRTETPTLAPERTTTTAGARSSDVVLPRTAAVLWSFVMLLALVLAFAAGLLVGHFLWTSPTATASTPAPASSSETTAGNEA